MGQICDFRIDLHSLHWNAVKVFPALPGIGSGSHAQDKNFFLFPAAPGHQRRRQGVVIIHPRQGIVLFQNGLDAEEYIGRQNDAVVIFFYL